MLPGKDQMNEALRQSKAGRFKTKDDEREHALSSSGFGPPDFGDEEESPSFFDQDSLSQRYADFEDEDPDAGTLDDSFMPELEEAYQEEDNFGFEPPRPWAGVDPNSYPVPDSLRQPGGAFMEDRPIFEGGPMQSELNSWKKQYESDDHGIFHTEHLGSHFVWRTLSRTEYREIMSLPNTDPLQREEIICEICVLFPYEYSFASMAAKKAGFPAVIAQDIMEQSGFMRPSAPHRL